MKGRRVVSPARRILVLCLLVVGVAGVAIVALASAAVLERGSPPQTRLEATHLPPLLTVSGEDVLLGYDVYCVGPDTDEDTAACDVTGSVFARAEERGPFTKLHLERASPDGEGRLVARVPEAIASAPGGFEYYAVLEAPQIGESLLVPAGGSSAPHRSVRLRGAVRVDLGRHSFGLTRRADARVAEASWGNGPSEAGLEGGRIQAPIGATAFDVDSTGAVYLLDEANRRILRWQTGSTRPVRMPVAVSGALADMAIAGDGSIYVLETAGLDRAPLVRRFDPFGRELDAIATGEASASQIRLGPAGPVVLQQPSHQWMPIVAGGVAAPPEHQRLHGRVGRPIGAGREVVVLRRYDEIRVAIVGSDGVRRAWRIASTTPLAEIQLAEPLGRNLVVVARAYTERRDEFVVLVLDEDGLVDQFTVDAADWAETAPLGRFTLVRSSLYRLGSTADGAFVDRYDLEVR